MLYWRSALKPLSLFSDGLPQQWVKDISDDYGGVLPEFLEYIQPYMRTPHRGDKKHFMINYFCNTGI